MSTYSGRKGAVTIDVNGTETLIAELNTWSVSMSGGSTDTSSFGDQWGKSDIGMLTWNGTASGFYDPLDDGQGELWELFTSNELNGTLKLYTQYSTTSSDPIKYWKPDTATDPDAGVRISGFNTGQTHTGVGTFDFTFEGSGPPIQVNTTVP